MNLTSGIPVLRVSDYPRAKAFYVDVLGFSVMEEAGDPVVGFGIFRHGPARVFLEAWQGAEAPYDRWRAYFHTTDIGEVAGRLRAAGTSFSGPTATEYGMTEIEVADPDGNVLCFGVDT
ncbi:VOC family protein [Pontivivens insulae]|uniref:VOC domain-containing protein n=1 Tax=Pontivivens insulae TaxID=1639689 RepID=A0A2R8ACF7_9RHOB|nr:VOC family protein [Pontivivens insulae]RED13867.1 putative enzyme related to lactoylglutathione lyase [Pontivivens insulae]SPF29941.1 hypothetical protein POI8812_02267 [Pontivivens insulae]